MSAKERILELALQNTQNFLKSQLININIYVSEGNLTAPYYRFYKDKEGTIDFHNNNLLVLHSHKTYTFKRLNNATTHPFYIKLSDDSTNSDQITITGDGSSTDGIVGAESFVLNLENYEGNGNILYYCTSHNIMEKKFNTIVNLLENNFVKSYMYDYDILNGKRWSKIGHDIEGIVNTYTGTSGLDFYDDSTTGGGSFGERITYHTLNGDGTVLAVGSPLGTGLPKLAISAGYVQVYEYKIPTTFLKTVSGNIQTKNEWDEGFVVKGTDTEQIVNKKYWTKRGPKITGQIFGVYHGDGIGRATSLNYDGNILACGYRKKNLVRVFEWKELTTDNYYTYHPSAANSGRGNKPIIIVNVNSQGGSYDTLTVGNYYWMQIGQDITTAFERNDVNVGEIVRLNNDGNILVVGDGDRVRFYEFNSAVSSNWNSKSIVNPPTITDAFWGDIKPTEIYDLCIISLSGNGRILAIGYQIKWPTFYWTQYVRFYKYDDSNLTYMGNETDGGTGEMPDYYGYRRLPHYRTDEGTIRTTTNRENHGEDSVWMSLNEDGTVFAVTQPNSIPNSDISKEDLVQVLEIKNLEGEIQWVKRGTVVPDPIGTDIAWLSNYSIKLNNIGNILAISCPNWDDGEGGLLHSTPNTDRMGLTKVFKWDDTNWNQLGQDIIGLRWSDFTGHQISLNNMGNILSVSTYKWDGENIDSSSEEEIDKNIGKITIYELV